MSDARKRAEEALARLMVWDERYRPLTVQIDARDLRALLAEEPEAAKAEKVLKEISAYCCQYETMGYDRDCAVLFKPGTVTCYSCRARRYFAEKEREAHIDLTPPPADAATEAPGYPPTLADARMHVERLTRSLSQPHSADERFFAINEARTWLAKTAAAHPDAATEAVGEAKERLWDALDRESLGGTYLAARGLRAALSAPAPAPSAKEMR